MHLDALALRLRRKLEEPWCLPGDIAPPSLWEDSLPWPGPPAWAVITGLGRPESLLRRDLLTSALSDLQA